MTSTANYLFPVIPFSNRCMKYGKGNYLYDDNGNKYLDLNSGQFCTVFGHANTEIIDSIAAQMHKLSHTSSSILASEVLLAAQNLNLLSRNMSAYSLLLSTGAEAIECAIRYAKNITKKNGLICFQKGYHGLSLGAQSVTFGGIYANPQIDNIFSISIPDSDKAIAKTISELETILAENHHKIAAMIFEPIVSVGGMIFVPNHFFTLVRNLCNKYNILLIFDECQTGFGRLGDWFAYQKMNVIPDIVVLAKGIGLGYPVSAVLFASSIIENANISITHYSSHQNDAFAASVINIGINYVKKYNLLNNIIEKGDFFLKSLTELTLRCQYLRNARGKGLMLGLDLYFKGVENYRPIYQLLFDRMMSDGVIMQSTDGGRVLRFLPDYHITHEQIEDVVCKLEKAIYDIR